jgi:hypothetical protein
MVPLVFESATNMVFNKLPTMILGWYEEILSDCNTHGLGNANQQLAAPNAVQQCEEIFSGTTNIRKCLLAAQKTNIGGSSQFLSPCANCLDKLTYADVIWDEEPLDTETMVGADWVYADLQLAQGTEEMLCKQVPLEAPILLEELNQDPNEVSQNSSDKTIAGNVRMALRMHPVVRDAVTMLSAYGDVDFAPALHILGQHGYTMVLAIPSSVTVSSALSSCGVFHLWFLVLCDTIQSE